MEHNEIYENEFNIIPRLDAIREIRYQMTIAIVGRGKRYKEFENIICVKSNQINDNSEERYNKWNNLLGNKRRRYNNKDKNKDLVVSALDKQAMYKELMFKFVAVQDKKKINDNIIIKSYNLAIDKDKDITLECTKQVLSLTFDHDITIYVLDDKFLSDDFTFLETITYNKILTNKLKNDCFYILYESQSLDDNLMSKLNILNIKNNNIFQIMKYDMELLGGQNNSYLPIILEILRLSQRKNKKINQQDNKKFEEALKSSLLKTADTNTNLLLSYNEFKNTLSNYTKNDDRNNTIQTLISNTKDDIINEINTKFHTFELIFLEKHDIIKESFKKIIQKIKDVSINNYKLNNPWHILSLYTTNNNITEDINKIVKSSNKQLSDQLKIYIDEIYNTIKELKVNILQIYSTLFYELKKVKDFDVNPNIFNTIDNKFDLFDIMYLHFYSVKEEEISLKIDNYNINKNKILVLILVSCLCISTGDLTIQGLYKFLVKLFFGAFCLNSIKNNDSNNSNGDIVENELLNMLNERIVESFKYKGVLEELKTMFTDSLLELINIY